MAILDKDQFDRIAEIVKRYTTWFTRRLFGESYSKETPNVNVNVEPLIELPASLIRLSFQLGLKESVLKEKEWEQLDWDALTDSLRPLTPVQELQVQASELSAHTRYRRLSEDITNGLYERLALETAKVVTEAQVRGVIKEQVKVGVAANRAYYDVAKDLVGQLKEQQRNWGRVASTEMHAARQNGIASAIVSKTDIYSDGEGEDSLVAVSMAPDACSDCRRLYLDPNTGKPKIFKLSELMANAGTNYQRPWRVNAKPVIPPLHPFCFCRLRYIPPGWGWNNEGRFTMINPKEAFPEVVKGELSKAIDEEPHSLLGASHSVLPEEGYIRGLHGENGIEELEHLIPRLKKLHQMYIRDEHLSKRLEELLRIARAQHHLESQVHVHHVGGGSDEQD